MKVNNAKDIPETQDVNDVTIIWEDLDNIDNKLKFCNTLRDEMEIILLRINSTAEEHRELIVMETQYSLKALAEAKMWLGFELQAIKKEVSKL